MKYIQAKVGTKPMRRVLHLKGRIRVDGLIEFVEPDREGPLEGVGRAKHGHRLRGRVIKIEGDLVFLEWF